MVIAVFFGGKPILGFATPNATKQKQSRESNRGALC